MLMYIELCNMTIMKGCLKDLDSWSKISEVSISSPQSYDENFKLFEVIHKHCIHAYIIVCCALILYGVWNPLLELDDDSWKQIMTAAI